MRKAPSLWIRIPLYIAIIVIMLLVNLPFIWMLVTAFKDESEVFTLPPKFYPNFFDFRNFAGAMAQIPMGRYLFNSLFVALSVTLLQLLFNSFAAYGLSRLRFKGRDFIFLILVGTLMVPPEVTLVPVSYTHLRAHETVLDLVCRLLLEKKKTQNKNYMKKTEHVK